MPSDELLEIQLFGDSCMRLLEKLFLPLLITSTAAAKDIGDQLNWLNDLNLGEVSLDLREYSASRNRLLLLVTE